MDFKLDSLKLITHRKDRTLESVVCQPTWLVVDAYTVPDGRCNIPHRYMFILSDGHHIVRALLTLSTNGNGLTIKSGDIIKIINLPLKSICESVSVEMGPLLKLGFRESRLDLG